MKKLYICYLLMFCVYMGANSQVVSSDSLAANYFNEVIISASRTEEKRSENPQQVVLLSRQQILNYNAQSMADLLIQSGKVFVQKSQQGGGSPVLRGFEASRVLLVIDGVRMNNLIYRAGHLQNIVTVDQNMLEKLEVVMGPSSTIYGSDALGGVIHMISRKPVLSDEKGKAALHGTAYVRYGSANFEKTGHASLSVGSSRFGSLTSATFTDFDDLRMGKERNPFYVSFGERQYYVERINGIDSLVKNNNPLYQRQSGFYQFDIMQKFSFKQSDKVMHYLNAQYSGSSNVPRYDRLTDPRGSGLNSAEWYYGPQKRLLTAYQMEYKSPGSALDRVWLSLSYQKVFESRHNRNFGGANRTNRREYVDVAGYTLDMEKKVKKHFFKFGIDGQFSAVRSRASRFNVNTLVHTPQSTRYPNGLNYMNQTALFFSHKLKISDQLVLTDGFRFGHSFLHSEQTDTTFYKFPLEVVNQPNVILSGSVGLVWNPKNWRNSIQVSTGYRVPNIDDLAKIFETAPGKLIVPNPNLKPEKSVNIDLGIAPRIAKIIVWENNVFFTYMKDAIVTSAFKYNGQDSIEYDGVRSQVVANQNQGKAYILGVSSILNIYPGKGFTCYAGFNYTYGRIVAPGKDLPLDHISPIYGNAGVSYKNKHWYAEIFALYNGWKKIHQFNLNGEDNDQYAPAEGMPAWFTLNVKAGYTIRDHYMVQVGMDNIFDTQYRTFSSGINGPGRNIFIALKGNF